MVIIESLILTSWAFIIYFSPAQGGQAFHQVCEVEQPKGMTKLHCLATHPTRTRNFDHFVPVWPKSPTHFSCVWNHVVLHTHGKVVQIRSYNTKCLEIPRRRNRGWEKAVNIAKKFFFTPYTNVDLIFLCHVSYYDAFMKSAWWIPQGMNNGMFNNFILHADLY